MSTDSLNRITLDELTIIEGYLAQGDRRLNVADAKRLIQAVVDAYAFIDARQHEAEQPWQVAEALRLANIEFSYLKAQKVFRGGGSVDLAWQTVKAAIAAMGEGAPQNALNASGAGLGNISAPASPASGSASEIPETTAIELLTSMLMAYHQATGKVSDYGGMKAVLLSIRPYLRTTEPARTKTLLEIHTAGGSPKPVMVDAMAALRASDALIRNIRHRDARWHDDEIVQQVLTENRRFIEGAYVD